MKKSPAAIFPDGIADEEHMPNPGYANLESRRRRLAASDPFRTFAGDRYRASQKLKLPSRCQGVPAGTATDLAVRPRLCQKAHQKLVYLFWLLLLHPMPGTLY